MSTVVQPTLEVSHPAVAATPRKRHAHLPGLDGVRGLAILMVICRHTLWPHSGFGRITNALLHLGTVGWAGVDLFFVLSGFLITGILIEARKRPHYFRNFYARRSVRVFPLYYGVITLAFILGHAFPGWDHHYTPDQAVTGSEWWWLWTYTINVQMFLAGHWFAHCAGPFTFGYFWSLAVEEHYYLVWPLIVLLCAPRRLLGVALVLAAASAIARGVYILKTGDTFGAYIFTPFHCDGLLVGAACAVLARRPAVMVWLRRTQYWQAGLSLGLFLIVYGLTFWDYDGLFVSSIGFALLAVIFGFFVLAAASPSPGPIVRTLTTPRWLRGLGTYSYGIYAIHLTIIHGLIGPITSLIRNHGVHSMLLSYMAGSFVTVLVAIGVAMLSFHLYEKPFLRLKRYFTSPGALDHTVAEANRPSLATA